MCNLCDENERKQLVDQLIDRQTDSSKVICPPFFDGGHNNTDYIKQKRPKQFSNCALKIKTPNRIARFIVSSSFFTYTLYIMTWSVFYLSLFVLCWTQSSSPCCIFSPSSSVLCFVMFYQNLWSVHFTLWLSMLTMYKFYLI